MTSSGLRRKESEGAFAQSGAAGCQHTMGRAGTGTDVFSRARRTSRPERLGIWGGSVQLPTLTQVSVCLISHAGVVFSLWARDGRRCNPSALPFVPGFPPCSEQEKGPGRRPGGCGRTPRGPHGQRWRQGFANAEAASGGTPREWSFSAGPARTDPLRIVMDAPPVTQPFRPEPTVLRATCPEPAHAPGGRAAERSVHGVPWTDRWCRDRTAVPCRPVTAPERGPTTPGPHLPREDGVSSLRCSPHRRRAPGWLWGRQVQRRRPPAVMRRTGGHGT
jgi:hypothetical protein